MAKKLSKDKDKSELSYSTPNLYQQPILATKTLARQESLLLAARNGDTKQCMVINNLLLLY